MKLIKIIKVAKKKKGIAFSRLIFFKKNALNMMLFRINIKASMFLYSTISDLGVSCLF
jgi:hypothetical protein